MRHWFVVFVFGVWPWWTIGCSTINSAILSCKEMNDNNKRDDNNMWEREDENENIKADDCLDFSFTKSSLFTPYQSIGIYYFFICRLYYCLIKIIVAIFVLNYGWVRVNHCLNLTCFLLLDWFMDSQQFIECLQKNRLLTQVSKINKIWRWYSMKQMRQPMVYF